MKSIKYQLLIVLLFVLLTVVGCSNNNAYKAFENDFMKAYSEITKYVNTKDIKETYITMQSPEIKDKLDNLNKIVENSKDTMPKNKESEYLEKSTWCKDLSYVIGNSKKWTELTVEERRKIINELDLMVIRVRNWKSAR